MHRMEMAAPVLQTWPANWFRPHACAQQHDARPPCCGEERQQQHGPWQCEDKGIMYRVLLAGQSVFDNITGQSDLMLCHSLSLPSEADISAPPSSAGASTRTGCCLFQGLALAISPPAGHRQPCRARRHALQACVLCHGRLEAGWGQQSAGGWSCAFCRSATHSRSAQVM